MKVSKLFFVISIIFITGCSNQKQEPSSMAQNSFPTPQASVPSADRVAYTEDAKRLLLGDILSGENNESHQFQENDLSKISTYTTKILTNDENRYNNIKIVADKLNGYILEPGNTFSFNDELGPYGKDDGFLEAKILLSNGEESTGYGGGVCQLSSTLYNAIKDLENIQITEHHHHSSPVAYVPKNQDATVSLQSGLDFKFINNYDFPLRFETSHNPNSLSVTVYNSSY